MSTWRLTMIEIWQKVVQCTGHSTQYKVRICTMRKKKVHLQAHPPMSAVAAPSLITCNPSWILQWQMQNSLYTLYYGGVFKGRWVFKGNLVSTSISSLLLIILCLAVTLLTSTKVQLGSKELSFLTKENNTGLAHLNMVWKCWHRLLFKRRPLGLEVHVVELDANIPLHLTKAFLSKS